MANRPKFLNFIRLLIEEIFIFQATVLKFGDLLRGWKLATDENFQLNISNVTPSRPKNTGSCGVNTSIAEPI